MTDWEMAKIAYLRESFDKARSEGKLSQWFLKQGIWLFLRLVVMLILVIPFKLIWAWTGRTSNGIAHVISFAVLAMVYLVILYAVVSSMTMIAESAQ